MEEKWTEEEIDMHQIHSYMITNYIHKIAGKWGQMQGCEIKEYEDLCEEGKKEIDAWYADYPTDIKNIRRIIEKHKDDEEEELDIDTLFD